MGMKEVAAARELFQFFADPREHPSDRGLRGDAAAQMSAINRVSAQRLRYLARVFLGSDEGGETERNRSVTGSQSR